MQMTENEDQQREVKKQRERDRKRTGMHVVTLAVVC